jgi:pimeloyl-ACP methyl ester carboxylesterase
MTTVQTLRIGNLAVLHAAPARASRVPVLFVHGYFADASVWTEWLPFFAERGFPAYAVNLRGRGGSDGAAHLGSATISDFADDAEHVARSIGSPAVVGHSMGGLLAQMLAERGAVSAAALIAPAPPRGITVLSPRLAIKQLKYLPPILRSRTVTPSREDLREIVLNRVPAAEQNGILDSLIPDSGRAARDMSITGVPVDHKRVRVPMFAITADEDRFIPKRIVERVAARYHAPLQTFTHHAHMLILEPGWTAVADAVARWIESV